jgi:hypothetical protein
MHHCLYICWLNYFNYLWHTTQANVELKRGWFSSWSTWPLPYFHVSMTHTHDGSLLWNGTYTTWFPQNKSIIKPKCFDRLYCFWYIHDTRRDVPIFKFLWTVKLRSKCDIWFTGVLWYDILLSTYLWHTTQANVELKRGWFSSWSTWPLPYFHVSMTHTHDGSLLCNN